MKKLIKNKFVILTICVIIVSMVYFIIQKAIDNYAFANNSDIVTEGGMSDNVVSNTEGEKENNPGQISIDETDLILEEIESSELEDNSTDNGQIDSSEDGITNKKDIVDVKKDNLSPNDVKKIYVYITGEVNNPGVVILDEGSRIVDAINAGGGTTTKANVSKVNLVYVLEDGMKVNIPNDKELKENSEFEYITMNSGDGGREDYSDSYRGGLSEDDVASEGEPKTKDYGVVNINTATQTELETLPGIGPSLALKIINYRKENGKFSTIDDIKNVSGIGDSKFENFRRYITI